MVDLTNVKIKEIVEDVMSSDKKNQRQKDLRRFEIYHGHLEPSLEEAIKKEFKKKETIEDLMFRLVPINIVRKIINKLAGLYIETPIRVPRDRNEADQMLLTEIEHYTRLNQRQKEANRYFKLFKRNLQESYLDEDGIMQVRNIPRHQYEVYSHSTISPQKPDTVVKIINIDNRNRENTKMVIWTPERHLIVNGRGEIDQKAMNDMNNPDGVNPYGALPFVYVNESSNYLNPIPNDDLLRVGILIPLLLTDLAFAAKYQTWSIIYVLNYDGELPCSPSSVISLPTSPDGKEPKIGTVRPDFDMGGMLQFVSEITLSLLSTNNLATSGVMGQLTANNIASGISKALDEATSIEDKKDQQEYFLKSECDYWELLSEKQIPYWRKTNQLNREISKEFSKGFDIDVVLREPAVMLTEQEKITVSKARLDNKFSTRERELKFLYPDMTNEQVQELLIEIEAEDNSRAEKQVETVNRNNPKMGMEDNGEELES